MTTALEQAFPLAANWVPATVRAKLAECGVFLTPTADLSAEDFSIQPWAAIAVYGPDGDLEFYAYDAGDTTTADDGGVSCIVVSGRRYKKRVDVIIKDSALSATTDTQPDSPTLGDTYVLPAAPSGDDWAGRAKTVATYTARGWIFREPFVGMVVYVEDEASFYHYDPNGDWVLGMGTGALPDGSITPKKLFHPFAILKVVDQRNAPPGGTPVNGTMYQVGTSPTGDFTGHSNDIARWNGSGWEFLEPEEGDTIYRLDIGAPYTFRSGAWGRTIPASPIRQFFAKTQTVNTSSASLTNRLSQAITGEVGQKIRITLTRRTYQTTGTVTFGVRIDSSGSTIATLVVVGSTGGSQTVYEVVSVVIDVPDAVEHTYHITSVGSGGALALNVTLTATFEVFQPDT
jgi:hypothetical protein